MAAKPAEVKQILGLGLALTAHKRALILRRVNKDALKLVERVAEILGHRTGYNGQLQRWKLPGVPPGIDRMIAFSGCEHEEDKQRFKGDPYDFMYFDEGTDFLESQYRFIIGWNRSRPMPAGAAGGGGLQSARPPPRACG